MRHRDEVGLGIALGILIVGLLPFLEFGHVRPSAWVALSLMAVFFGVLVGAVWAHERRQHD